MKSPLLLFHTIRYLKARQIVGRAWFHLYRPRPPTVRGALIRTVPRSYQKPLRGPQSLYTTRHPQHDTPLMRILGDELVIAQESDWNHADKAKLFLYNVHYFDDLNAADAPQRQALHVELIDRWINENPPPVGNGWEPYPLSLRIVNWIQFFSRQQSVPDHWLDSLATQAHYLSRRLEYHLLGNHLFTNAKSLVFAGCYLQNADSLLRTGLRIIQRELPEQVLPDGGHFELSPMYHCIAMDDLMDLINLAQCYPQQISEPIQLKWQHTLHGMFLWLGRMCHPDGQISLFNDAALDIAPDYDALTNYANTLQLDVPAPTASGLHHARNSGYVSLHSENVACMMDIGHIGPDYLPGHAHADSLTFELSVFGHRLICNSGTSVYGTGAERLRQRGTAAHNTVFIDQQNSSEVWSGFRVARRARPVNISVTGTDSSADVCAAHTGYRRLAGRNNHTRCWSIREGSLSITDSVAGRFSQAQALFHLHPSVQADAVEEGVQLTLPDNQQVFLRVEGGVPSIEAGTWHPRFGQTIATHRLVIPLSSDRLTTVFTWSRREMDA